jgi:hypothetical protein
VYQGPVGRVENGLEIGDPTVFQIGLVKEIFVPYIGMMHRTENTGGPSVATYDLIYARLGGITVLEEPQIGFRLSLDKRIYVSDQMPPVDSRRAIPQMTARITLRVNQPRPLAIEFPSTQVYDLAIMNDKGEKVFQTLQFGPGEANFVIVVPLRGANGPLPQGKYTAEAWLATGAKRYTSTVTFDVLHVF